MKALEILLEMQYAIDTTGVDDMIGLNEAIKEIEELQDKYNTQQEFIKKFMTDSFNGRSCDGCKHWQGNPETPTKGICIQLGVHNIGGCGDYWEPKQ